MTREETRFILSTYRPDGQDSADPAFADALQSAESDPQLRDWFREEQMFDTLVSDKLRTVLPPAGLRDRILAGGRASTAPLVPWFQQTRKLALAASIVLIGLISAIFLRYGGSSKGADLPRFATNFVSHDFDLQGHGGDLVHLTSWLADRKAPVPGAIPPGLTHLEGLGCRTLKYEGHDISLLCFGKDGREYHLFVANRTDFPQVEDTTKPQTTTRDGWSAASWTDDKHYYVMVTEGPVADLQRML